MLARLRLRRGDLDATELAAPTDLNLRLDRAGVADLVGGGDGFVAGRRGLAVRHGDAVTGEELLALVLK